MGLPLWAAIAVAVLCELLEDTPINIFGRAWDAENCEDVLRQLSRAVPDRVVVLGRPHYYQLFLREPLDPANSAIIICGALTVSIEETIETARYPSRSIEYDEFMTMLRDARLRALQERQQQGRMA